MLFAYLVCIACITNSHVQTFCLWKTLCSRKNQKRKKALGKKKKSFVKATGTGGAPRCHPDYEQNKMSNTNFETRFAFIYASTSLDTKTSTIASNRNFGNCMLIRCLAPQHIFRFFHFCFKFFVCLWQLCPLLWRSSLLLHWAIETKNVSAMGYFCREVLIHRHWRQEVPFSY